MTTFQRRLLPVLCLGLASGLMADTKVAKKDFPPAAMAAFTKAYPNAKIMGLGMEKEDGKTLFEVESVDGKVRRDVQYLEDGTVTEVEEGVAVADLPAEVKSAAMAKHPSGSILKAEKATKGAEVTYDLKVKDGKSTFGMEIDPAGKVSKDQKREPRKQKAKQG